MRRHPVALANATKAYAEATSSSVKLLIAENKRTTKELQAARQGEEQSTTSTRAKMKKAILVKVSTLETVMQRVYDRFITVHKAILHLNGHQQCCTKIA